MIQAITYPSIADISKTERPLLAALAMLVVIRMIAILITPLEFGVDEAQYWLWGQALDFGYYSKPPLIGWYLGLSEGLFGASEAAARIATPLLHFIISIILYMIACAHHSQAAGRWAALLWISLPIVSLGSFVISTDSLLLVPWVLALAMFFKAQTNKRQSLYFYTGLLIGIGLLAKYAAVYFLLGAGISILAMPVIATPLWDRIRSLACLIGGALVTSAPNLLWNLANRGVTIAHLGENADLSRPLYSPLSAFEFLLSQSAVIGPIAFIIFCASLLRLGTQQNQIFARRLIWFSVPVLVIMILQAFLKTANANWAATAWPTACLLMGCALAQKRPSEVIGAFWGKLALSVNIFAALFIALAVGLGSLGFLTPQSDPLRRLRGWQALANDTMALAQNYEATIIIADRRAEAATLSYHLHDTDYQIKVLDDDGRPGSHFELNHALDEAARGPFLIMTGPDGQLPKRFANAKGPIGASQVPISETRTRHKLFFISQ